MRILIFPMLLLMGCGSAEPAAAQDRPELPPFQSVLLSNGGEVIVRYGPVQRVTIAAGEADLRVEGDRLRIDHCRACPRSRVRRRIDIVTPVLDSVSVDNGGRIVLAGEFPPQDRLSAAVAHGGAIDARPLAANRVTASVTQGGSIFTRAGARLDAVVSDGGIITYWGRPEVRASNRRSAGVVRGRDQDLDRPLSELGPAAPPHVPPRPPVPPKPGG